MIIKVLLRDKDGSEFTMMFGDSYKKWQTQFCEFMFRYYKPDPSMGWSLSYAQGKALKAWKSNAKWKGWGGLKWCREEVFQKELDREDCQHDDPDNPNPRKYSDMIFVECGTAILDKALKDY